MAILSRLPILASMTHILPHSDGAEPREALEVEVGLPNGRHLLFVSKHLDYQWNPKNRMAQAARIRDLYTDSKLPIFLAGDLNAIPDSKPIALFLSAWSYAGRENPQPSFPTNNPSRKIDYILHKPTDRWCSAETRVVDEKWHWIIVLYSRPFISSKALWMFPLVLFRGTTYPESMKTF